MPSKEIENAGELSHAEHRARQLIQEAQEAGFRFVVIPKIGNVGDLRNFIFSKERVDASNFVEQIKPKDAKLVVSLLDSNEAYKALTGLMKANMDFKFKLSNLGNLTADYSR